MTDQGYIIRPAKNSDVAAVTALWEIMAAQHRDYDAEVWCWSAGAAKHWSRWYRDLLLKPEMILPVAQFAADKKLVGFALASYKDNPNIFTVTQTGQVWDLFVHPDHRRQGIGLALAKWTLDSLKALGAQDVKLHVAIANPAAMRLYEKLGLRAVMYRMYKRL
jgi:ribosomal protein S18 acetylase RimI-like enzyme